MQTTEINPNTITNWRTARKTGTLVALLGSLVIQHHPRLVGKLKLNVLEGDEPINPGAMVCIGPAGDVWQWTLAKLEQKYRIAEVAGDGWTRFTPKLSLDASVDAVQITAEMTHGWPPYLMGCHRGNKQPDGSFNQTGKVGDWVVRLKTDPTDFYFVDERVFANTYSLV